MTEAEAQELIAEIKKEKELFCPNSDYVQCISEHYIKHLEKIINRFANKPPYYMSLSQSAYVNDNPDSELLLSKHMFFEKNATLSLACPGEKGYQLGLAVRLNIEELKQLIDNCNKMLEYLNAT